MKWVGAHKNNFGVGRAGHKIKYIVVHWIVGTLESADATFQNPDRIASATYGVGDDEVHQYVKEEDTPYTNGNLTSNRESITIEHEGSPTLPITDLTYKTSGALIADIAKRHNIPLDRAHIKGHKEISATQCPGTLDIDRLIDIAKNTEPTVTITQKELDKIRADRDENWNLFQGAIEDLREVDREYKDYKKEQEIKYAELLKNYNDLVQASEQNIEIEVPRENTTADSGTSTTVSTNPIEVPSENTNHEKPVNQAQFDLFTFFSNLWRELLKALKK